ncbi:Diguanylate cyclase DosC [Vibrio thalassae]|uniref:diguanylate cyclase n=1 Tax=Vibrio thalassae TaxID=1243014 RepID=A0A240EM33_9VIBR|nr:Diguanylate cyclase DosC [Vibrio thalassae]
MKHEIAAFKRHDQEICCVMLDVDGFKSINDRYGHAVGDYVLQTVGKILIESTREEDFCFRFGGDEFTILLPKTSLPDAYKFAERVREAVANRALYSTIGEAFNIKVSLGVATMQQGKEEQLLAIADEALMEVKTNTKGKNTTYVFCDRMLAIFGCDGCTRAGRCK